MFVSTTVLSIIALFLLIYYFQAVKNVIFTFINLSKLPGPPANDIISGNMLPLYTTPVNIFKILREWGRRFYPIYKLFAVHLIAANILSPEDCELILSNPKHMEKSIVYSPLHDWLGTGLLTSTGSKWQIRRKILAPAFHFNILQEFITIFNEETENLVDILKTKCDKPFININNYISQFALKTILETAMGTKLKFNNKKEHAYIEAIINIGEILIHRLIHPWLLYKIIYLFSPTYFKEKKSLRVLHTFTKNVIRERQEKYKTLISPNEETKTCKYESRQWCKEKKRLAMLDLLLTAKYKEKLIDDEGIREEVDTFMFAGHDTTSVALSFALMLIACHPKVQDNLAQEMNDIFGDLHKKPTYNDLQELKYMECTIKEVLRLYPSVHFISRKLGEDLITHSGYFLPKNSIVNLHIYDIHHNPDIYPDPEKFDPDRFLPENSQNRHPFAYLPFSAGPRSCIGKKFAMLELKAALCGILANFVLKPVDTPSSVVIDIGLVLRAKDGVKVEFIPRI